MCVGGGRCVCLEKRSGVSVVCVECVVVRVDIFNVIQILAFMNFMSGTRYTGHS